MATDIAIKGTADIEVIKHRIYEVRGLRLRSQIATLNTDMSNIENNVQFSVENFDCKIMKETKQDAKKAA